MKGRKYKAKAHKATLASPEVAEAFVSAVQPDFTPSEAEVPAEATPHLYYLNGTRTTIEYAETFMRLRDLENTSLEMYDGVGTVENVRRRMTGSRYTRRGFFGWCVDKLLAAREGVFGYSPATHAPVLESLRHKLATPTSQPTRIVIGAHSRGAAVGALAVLGEMYQQAQRHLQSDNSDEPLWPHIDRVSFVLLDPVSGTDNNMRGLEGNSKASVYSMIHAINRASGRNLIKVSAVLARYYMLDSFQVANEWAQYLEHPHNRGVVDISIAGFGHTDMVFTSTEKNPEQMKYGSLGIYRKGNTPVDLSKAILERELSGGKNAEEVERMRADIKYREQMEIAALIGGEDTPLKCYTSPRKYSFTLGGSKDWLCDATMFLLAKMGGSKLRGVLLSLNQYIKKFLSTFTRIDPTEEIAREKQAMFKVKSHVTESIVKSKQPQSTTPELVPQSSTDSAELPLVFPDFYKLKNDSDTLSTADTASITDSDISDISDISDFSEDSAYQYEVSQSVSHLTKAAHNTRAPLGYEPGLEPAIPVSEYEAFTQSTARQLMPYMNARKADFSGNADLLSMADGLSGNFRDLYYQPPVGTSQMYRYKKVETGDEARRRPQL